MKLTFITPANQAAFLQHRRHVPGAFRDRRPAFGRWSFPLADGAVYVPALLGVEDLTPREKWPELIARKNSERSWLADILPELPGNPIQDDQGDEGTCWLHGPCRAVNAAWLLAMGHSHKLASNSLGEDFGWRVANGGDPSAAIESLVKNGAARWEFCQPPMARSHSQWSAGWQANRALHKALTGHLIDGMNGDTFASRCEMAFRNIPSSVGYTRWSHEIFGAIKVIDLQQSSIEMLDDFAEAGGFCHVPREVVLNPKFLGAPRFQAVDWNQWGTDTEFPTNDWAPDIDLTGYLATSIPNQ